MPADFSRGNSPRYLPIGERPSTGYVLGGPAGGERLGDRHVGRVRAAEVEGLRNYLLKGGFLIVDDFRSDWELYNFQEHMRRVRPGHSIHQLDVSHEIFNSFFEIADLNLAPPTFRYPPAYLAMFEDDDPEKRLMVMINYNNDLGEYWEFSDVGYYPIDLSNEAYKLSVNYIVYALTH